MCGNIQDFCDLKMLRTVAYLASVLWLDTESFGFNAEVRGLGQFEICLLLTKTYTMKLTAHVSCINYQNAGNNLHDVMHVVSP